MSKSFTTKLILMGIAGLAAGFIYSFVTEYFFNGGNMILTIALIFIAMISLNYATSLILPPKEYGLRHPARLWGYTVFTVCAIIVILL